jgi:hypothetical protein
MTQDQIKKQNAVRSKELNLDSLPPRPPTGKGYEPKALHKIRYQPFRFKSQMNLI